VRMPSRIHFRTGSTRGAVRRSKARRFPKRRATSTRQCCVNKYLKRVVSRATGYEHALYYKEARGGNGRIFHGVHDCGGDHQIAGSRPYCPGDDEVIM